MYDDVADQGHISIALGGVDDKVLQSFARNGVWPGVNTDYTARQSHNGGYYKYIIKREIKLEKIVKKINDHNSWK